MNEKLNLILVSLILFLGIIYVFLRMMISLRDRYEDKHKSSTRFQNAVLKGKISEHMAPYLPGFHQI